MHLFKHFSPLQFSRTILIDQSLIVGPQSINIRLRRTLGIQIITAANEIVTSKHCSTHFRISELNDFTHLNSSTQFLISSSFSTVRWP